MGVKEKLKLSIVYSNYMIRTGRDVHFSLVIVARHVSSYTQCSFQCQCVTEMGHSDFQLVRQIGQTLVTKHAKDLIRKQEFPGCIKNFVTHLII